MYSNEVHDDITRKNINKGSSPLLLNWILLKAVLQKRPSNKQPVWKGRWMLSTSLIALCPKCAWAQFLFLIYYNITKKLKLFSTLHAATVIIIGLQSELLGAAALGVHNILTLTGDKPDNGDHPFAQSVFEVDCMGLLNIAKTLNAGKDLAGNDLDAPTNFYIGATGNPGAPDLEIERQKLAAKIQNGAHFVQTQPIYDLEQAKHYIDKMSEFDVPIMRRFDST